jgi:tRNA (guanine37-N1)-methyltransferase
MQKFIILTLFPKIFQGFLQESLLKKAIDKDIIAIELINLRNFGIGRHRQVDDAPFGGGPGMVLRVDVMHRAISKIKSQNSKIYSVLLDPKGKVFDQATARRLSQSRQPILLICGRYEGFDERIRNLADEEISLGSFILNGGEVAAMAIIEATARLIPGFVGKEQSLKQESFSQGRNLEYPHYTRPENFMGERVPKVLLSGNHQAIDQWRKKHTKTGWV